MNNPGGFTAAAVRDLLILGVAGGIVAGLMRSEAAAVSFLLGCLWLAFNFTLLAWILSMFGAANRPSGSFVFWLVCAKIPASYFLLYWLYAVDYLDAAGLTAGLLALPVVLVYRGLAWAGKSKIEEKDS